jgi:hypothetical protein
MEIFFPTTDFVSQFAAGRPQGGQLFFAKANAVAVFGL